MSKRWGPGWRPSWWVYRRGLRWLRSGYCPKCYSSPPWPSCTICEGETRYGYRASEETLRMWGARWYWERIMGEGLHYGDGRL